MSVLLGQSIFYDTARSLNNNYPVSYYQFRAITSLVEALVLHDEAYILVGSEQDQSFVNEYEWLIQKIKKESDFEIKYISPENRNLFIDQQEIKKFEEICTQVYKYPLGITTDDIFIKRKKGRTEEDMSDHIENSFIKEFPEFYPNKTAEEIYYLWQKNSNSSELMYFFRTHLIQAICETKFYTPLFENQKILSSILQRKLRSENRIGTIPYVIYNLINMLFISECEKLSYESNYPATSLLLNRIIEDTEHRSDILGNILKLRKIFADFRNYYKDIEKVLFNSNLKLAKRSEKANELKQSLEKVWMPISTSFSESQTTNAIWRGAKSFFAKCGVGDLKVSISEKNQSTEGSLNYSTASLISIGTTLAQTILEIKKDSKLYKPSSPLLKLLEEVVNQYDTRKKFEYFLPIKHFNYRINKLMEKNLFDVKLEVIK